MNTTLIIILVALFTLILGFIIGTLISKLKTKQVVSDLEKEMSAIEINQSNMEVQKREIQNRLEEKVKEIEEIRREKEFSSIELARKNEELKNLQLKLNENKEEVEKLQDKFTKEFENLANKILDEKSTKFTAQNKENIQNILNPLQEKIKTFEKKVDDTQKESISMHSALKEQLLGLKELNAQMSKEAINLTKALKGDSKTQGNWGELVLERVLEKSGLEKDREYFVQQSFTNEEGKRILPDVVIHLPDNKKMIVDSKVSLTAYEQYVNAEDEAEKERFLKEHLNSLKRHVEQLSDKKYEDIYKIASPDFVLLFVPIEPAFAVALNLDNTLYNKAFERNIVIVTPTTLLATLRTIDTMWNNEKQQRNAIEIARQAGALYDKFEGLLKDLISIGKKIDGTKADYTAAMNKLVDGRGNLITSVEKLKKMGAKAKKALPQTIIERAEDNE
ncbi:MULTISPECIES: DNA recombination protein RmuC [Tenacibaculum]|uniref:DNA recombination protein RmuC n=1 Tax=Tenacibaculum aiptasiae TaxID=426481 RepID=A0A7J5APF2_9FLAO|nr:MULTISPECIES: DNA recombination protein RmuC [Tenacibaculum]KAB1159481.1 DNA recombination protein RmuC [Tenacibaculum aiptasiae]MCF2875804.1 DNA recombination protein RmuC [Tenacibaculum sp. Cn5-1]MCF2935879.1 DNA recombination protein RmuC [Tenacibaculum sp. Cn5-34]MCG7512440.1 DNA recombination protein RmuC [Tenacibaculum sp. Cn5-46]